MLPSSVKQIPHRLVDGQVDLISCLGDGVIDILVTEVISPINWKKDYIKDHLFEILNRQEDQYLTNLYDKDS